MAINGFVLVRLGDRKMVAPPGRSKSYVKRIERARIFETREAAEADKCGNEIVASVDAVSRR